MGLCEKLSITPIREEGLVMETAMRIMMVKMRMRIVKTDMLMIIMKLMVKLKDR